MTLSMRDKFFIALARNSYAVRIESFIIDRSGSRWVTVRLLTDLRIPAFQVPADIVTAEDGSYPFK